MRGYLKICPPLIITFMLIVSCSTIEDPITTLDLHVSKLTKNEYATVGTKGYDHATINDFKKFSLILSYYQSNNVTYRKIEIPSDEDFFKLIDTIDRIRFITGDTSEQDNKGENFARYTKEFIFYSKGLSEEQIRKAYSTAIITVTWATDGQKKSTKKYVIGDVIKFEKMKGVKE